MCEMDASSPVAPMEFHAFSGPQPGPHLLILGAVHGNETCGSIAIRHALAQLRRGELSVRSGRVTLVPIANPAAYALQKRQAGRDLNRNFSPVEAPQSSADFYVNAIADLMSTADVLLDLHSYKAEGAPFLYAGPENNRGALEPFECADEELAFAKSLGISRMVCGWLPAYDRFVREQTELFERSEPAIAQKICRAKSEFGRGTTEYFRSLGKRIGVTVECGNHWDQNSVSVARQVIERALDFVCNHARKNAEEHFFADSFHFEKIFLREDDGDRLAKPFKPFEKVRNGQLLGQRKSGAPLLAPADGAVIFCYDDEPVGSEWIYFAADSTRGLRI